MPEELRLRIAAALLRVRAAWLLGRKGKMQGHRLPKASDELHVLLVPGKDHGHAQQLSSRPPLRAYGRVRGMRGRAAGDKVAPSRRPGWLPRTRRRTPDSSGNCRRSSAPKATATTGQGCPREVRGPATPRQRRPRRRSAHPSFDENVHRPRIRRSEVAPRRRERGFSRARADRHALLGECQSRCRPLLKATGAA